MLCRTDLALDRKICKKSKAGLKSKQRDRMGMISQTYQGTAMCWILFKKAKKIPKDYLKLVFYFSKDFLCLLVLSIKIDLERYNNTTNYVQKTSKLEKEVWCLTKGMGGVGDCGEYRSLFPAASSAF